MVTALDKNGVEIIFRLPEKQNLPIILIIEPFLTKINPIIAIIIPFFPTENNHDAKMGFNDVKHEFGGV